MGQLREGTRYVWYTWERERRVTDGDPHLTPGLRNKMVPPQTVVYINSA